ncbi:putative immunity protein [Lactiplantibacillus mudanjiangensis]|uniref:Imm-5-like domain-containing protein n=1 Tax=Lactiplantibacillus mudanjiangensis TaxID=1296538 RepID=A0A660E3W0_9LACO|nr:hypothetical protein [Lactiplantibacillus mudanjiangensis]VDG21348.1 hypothetical protein [Lactobacillus sp. CBA3605] [Lactiplantibacillus mudanjiangensis]VDG23571.1 hypothetical protein [Lactobacillus sp. CBA3605] [Lactiplantibacillus mudanjiangensis]VDG28805.1 hypothetical protein [Lactobacillus sp. CBA3605] [Lactiplantibacillus mudanjiangensis]VDG32182.1 hypothetical protein [Lactobacillus sp. CBA3605] [Lactiplantibacillus mudanjiangensis]
MTEGFRPSHPKISIDDDPGIRSQIESLTGELSQQQLAKWALIIAKKAMAFVDDDQQHERQIRLALDANELWQVNLASVYQVRQASAKVEALVAKSTSSIGAAALECISWAIASAYVDDNALRAADQAIKLVNLTQPNDAVAVTAERQWQYQQLADLARNINLGIRHML